MAKTSAPPTSRWRLVGQGLEILGALVCWAILLGLAYAWIFGPLFPQEPSEEDRQEAACVEGATPWLAPTELGPDHEVERTRHVVREGRECVRQ